jgi:epoxyqueuosine reductase
MMAAQVQGPPILAELRARAGSLGFDAFGIAAADARPDLPAKLGAALAAGWHGDMGWLETTAERRGAPTAMWPEARSVIMLGVNYGPDRDPLETLARRTGAEVKVFVDTAPLMEKPLAEAAGLGWQGKHTVLVSRTFGSWLFLGAILTDIELPADTPQPESCGSCTRCLDVCPTQAFPAPFQLDARRCLAYLTVEHKGPIPREFRVAMGNRVYGCDDCLAVCPWNKFASATHEAKLMARDELNAPALADLVRLDDAAFRALFAGSPVKRIGVARFLRNVLIAIGNSGDPDFLAAVEARHGDPQPLVRGAAIWALRRLAPDRATALEAQFLPGEPDPEVRAEWTEALAA